MNDVDTRTPFTPLIYQYTRPWTHIYKKNNASLKDVLIPS